MDLRAPLDLSMKFTQRVPNATPNQPNVNPNQPNATPNARRWNIVLAGQFRFGMALALRKACKFYLVCHIFVCVGDPMRTRFLVEYILGSMY